MATLGLAAIGPAGKLGGQGPSGLFSVALVVAQAMIMLADEFVPDPAERLLVAVTETASMLIQRPGPWVVLTALNDQSRQVSNRRVLRTRRINTALPLRRP